MTMSVKAEPQKTSTGTPEECAGCGKKIQDRYLLKALDMFWHEDCLKCGCCDCRLGEVGSTLYTKGNLILCKRDYLRLFGTTGYCAACNKVIPAFEMVMRARTNVYHLECFACQQCNHRFCVGDRFFLCDNKILCEYDYEERMVFANLAYNSSNLAQMKQQARSMTSSPSTNGVPPPNSNSINSPHNIPGSTNSSNNNSSSSNNHSGSPGNNIPPPPPGHHGGLPPSHSKSLSSTASTCVSSSMSLGPMSDPHLHPSHLLSSSLNPSPLGHLHSQQQQSQQCLPPLLGRPVTGPPASLLPLPPPPPPPPMSNSNSSGLQQSPMVT